MKTKTHFFARNFLASLTMIFMIGGLAVGAIPQAEVFAQGNSIAESSENDGLRAQLLQDDDRPDAAVTSEFRDAIRGFVNYFLAFLGLIAVIFIVYAGILMVTAGGDDEAIGKAKKILLWAGAGLIVVMLSFAIVKLFVRAGDAVQ